MQKYVPQVLIKFDAQILNAQVFEEQRERSWAEVLLDAEQAHADLLATVECFSEDDLVRSGWPPPEDGEQGVFSESQPLWGIILGNGFWHLLEHFTQFYLDRSEVWRATQLQQAWADKVTQEDLPHDMQSIELYTLALFYAMTKQETSAQETLRQALALNPDLVECSKQDPVMTALLGE